MREIEIDMNEQTIERYLFGEMSEDEQAALEAEFFERDELFAEIAEIENHLVDLFVRGKLAGESLARFERSLEKFPARRAKIENAKVLRDFVAEEKSVERNAAKLITADDASEKQSFGARLRDFFTLKTPALAFSSLALLALFAGATALLFVENRRQTAEIARLQQIAPETDAEKIRREELKIKLKTSGERVGELEKLTENQTKAGDALAGELENERAEKERLERALEQLRRERNAPSVAPTPKVSSAPTIATFLLTPTVSGKTGAGNAPRNLSVKTEIERVSMQLVLPEETKADEKLIVKLNAETLLTGAAPNVSANGQKTLRVSFAANKLTSGANVLTVINSAGVEITKYVFNSQAEK